MLQTDLAPNRPPPPPGLRAARLWPVALLVIATLSICTRASEAHEPGDEPVATTPNFRFEPPLFIVGLRAGASFNRSRGEIHRFLEDNLTIGDSNFNSGVFAMDLGVRATAWLDVVFGFEYSGNYEKSEFRDFVEASGAPIEQKTRLIQVPMTVSLKLYPFGRGRQVGKFAWIRFPVVPYFGGGIGGTYYQLKQKGDFVDFMDLSIFEAKLESSSTVFSQHVFVGLDFRLTRNIGLVFEGRYQWAEASLKGDFNGFDPIELDGARAMMGINFRL